MECLCHEWCVFEVRALWSVLVVTTVCLCEYAVLLYPRVSMLPYCVYEHAALLCVCVCVCVCVCSPSGCECLAGRN